MTAAKVNPNESLIRKAMLGASTVLFAALVGYFIWLGTAMVALQRDAAVIVQVNKAMAANIEILMVARNSEAARLVERNSRRLDAMDAGQAGTAVVPIPVIVENPPTSPVPVDPAPKAK